MRRNIIAFSGIPRPSITKRIARAHDDHLPLIPALLAEIGQLDTELVWADVRKEDLVKFSEYFNFSDAEEWRFYLPAFISFELRHYPSGSGYPALERALENPAGRLALLSPDQQWCVGEHVALMRKPRRIAAWLQADFFVRDALSSRKSSQALMSQDASGHSDDGHNLR